MISGGNDRSGWRFRVRTATAGRSITSIGDRATGTIWAGGGGDWHGAGVWRTEDGGESWQVTRLTKGTMDDWAANDPDFARMIGWTDAALPFGDRLRADLVAMPCARPALCRNQAREPAGRATNGGKNWERIEALTEHPSAGSWNPGAAGLVLHTIVSDPANPKKLWVGISAAGVFATEDGGATWERRNRLSNAEASDQHDHPAAPRDGEIGHCVHNMMRAPGTSDLLYQQNHHGVWRSADGGRSWDDITEGLPSTFGFPIRVHPRDPNTIWTLPLNGDMAGRFPPDAAAAVWRSRDGGQSLAGDAPRSAAGRLFTSLCSRQAMAGDERDRSGDLLSAQTVARSSRASMKVTIGRRSRDHLPTILAVEVICERK